MSNTTFPVGPFTIDQALGAGATRSQLRSALADGRLQHVSRDVYLDALAEQTITTRARAALLTTSRHVVVCDRAASWIHGVDAWRYRELDVPPPLEVCVLRGHEPSERPELRCLTRDLARDDVMTIDGLRVTTPLRTALDLGCRLGRRDAFAVMNALAGAHAFDRYDVLRALPRYRGRRGVVQLRQLAPHVEPRVESQRESWVLIDIIDHHLPTPEPQWWVEIDDVPTFRLDFAYPHAKVVVEYDGDEFHTSAEDRANDERRRAWLRANGWIVIVVTKESFTYDAVPAWIGELRMALRVAG